MKGRERLCLCVYRRKPKKRARKRCTIGLGSDIRVALPNEGGQADTKNGLQNNVEDQDESHTIKIYHVCLCVCVWKADPRWLMKPRQSKDRRQNWILTSTRREKTLEKKRKCDAKNIIIIIIITITSSSSKMSHKIPDIICGFLVRHHLLLRAAFSTHNRWSFLGQSIRLAISTELSIASIGLPLGLNWERKITMETSNGRRSQQRGGYQKYSREKKNKRKCWCCRQPINVVGWFTR